MSAAFASTRRVDVTPNDTYLINIRGVKTDSSVGEYVSI